MACNQDESSLPILSGCPGPNELIVVGNAVGGLDMNGGYTTGYARRYIKDLIHCFLNSLVFIFDQFTVGQGGSPISSGSNSFILTAPTNTNIVQDSINVIFGGVVMDRNDNTQFSYGVQYNVPAAGQATITFNDNVQNGQNFIVTYTYA